MFAILFILGGVLSGLGLYYLLMISVLLAPAILAIGAVGFGIYSALKLIDSKNAFIMSRPARILIVEDDLDMAAAAKMAFDQLGCVTSVATNVSQARKMLRENSTDIIIMDWMLQNNINTGDIIEELCDARLMNKRDVRAKVVTCSNLGVEQINFPETEQYDYLDHWQKPISFSDFKNRSSELVAAVAL
jgi:CheY-like chemotaxis protein